MTPTEQIAASRIAIFTAMGEETRPQTTESLSGVQIFAALLKRLADEQLTPVAQRHPLALVLGAAVAGALLVQTKPWRLPGAALLAQLVLTSLVGPKRH